MSGSEPTYDRLVAEAGEGLGHACRVYGINPLYGRLYAALFLRAEPISLGDLVDQLGVAKSTVSVAVRKLVAFGVVRRVNKPGDRRDYYAIVDDPYAVITHLLRNFVTAEIREGTKVVDALQQGLTDPSGDGWPDEVGIDILRARTEALAQMTQVSAHLVGNLLQHPDGVTRAHLTDLAGALTTSDGASPEDR